MALKGKNNEKKIWNFLTGKGLSAHGAAGFMGNLYAESALDSMNLQNTYEKSLGYTDAGYTAAVDTGKYTNFVNDCAGYGLAQWTYYTRKEALLKYAKAVGARSAIWRCSSAFYTKSSAAATRLYSPRSEPPPPCAQLRTPC